MSLETFNPAEPPHKWTPTKPHKVYSPWVLSSRRASRSMSVSQPLSSLSPTKQHVSGATHAPRRPPPPLKPIRSNSYSAASVGAPSEETSQRTTTKVGSRKRRATLDTPQTSAMCLAFQNVSLDTPQTSPTQEESVTASASFRLTQLESVAERSVVAVKPTLPPIQVSNRLGRFSTQFDDSLTTPYSRSRLSYPISLCRSYSESLASNYPLRPQHRQPATRPYYPRAPSLPSLLSHLEKHHKQISSPSAPAMLRKINSKSPPSLRSLLHWTTHTRLTTSSPLPATSGAWKPPILWTRLRIPMHPPLGL